MTTYLIRGGLVVLALGAAMFAASVAYGDCRAINRNVVVARNAVAVDTVLATAFVPVIVPAYTVGYSGGGAAADEKTEKRVTDLEKKLERLLQLLEKGAAPGVAPAAPAAKQEERDPHLPVFVARCASCHESGVSKAKGGGLTLLRSVGSEMQGVALSAEQRLAVVREVYEGTMPKGKTACTDEETAAVVKGMTRK